MCGFCDVTSTADGVVESHEHTAARSIGISRQFDGVIEIQGAVRAERRGRTHRTHEHHGFVAVDSEVEEEGGFFHRVRAVRDHDAVDFGLVQEFIAAFGQFKQERVGHVLAADFAYLLTRNVGKGFDLRHGINQRLNAELTGLILGHLRARGRSPGDRPARGKNMDVGQIGSHGGRHDAAEQRDQQCFPEHSNKPPS